MEMGIAYTSNGAIEYTLKGNGPVILNLHGGHSNCQEKLGYNSLIKSGYSVLTPSRPGYGKTASLVGETPERTADSMIALLDYLHLDQVFVIGVSAGGPTAIVLASKYPNRVKKLILESAITKTWLTKNDVTYKMAKIIFNPKLQKLTWFLIKTFNNLFPKFFAKMYLSQFSTLNNKEIMSRMTEEDIEEIRKLNNRYSSDKGFIIDLGHDVEQKNLKNIIIPTLIIHSKYDKSVPFEHAEYAHKNIKDSKLYMNDFWGHLIWIGKGKEKRNKILIEFLNEK